MISEKLLTYLSIFTQIQLLRAVVARSNILAGLAPAIYKSFGATARAAQERGIEVYESKVPASLGFIKNRGESLLQKNSTAMAVSNTLFDYGAATYFFDTVFALIAMILCLSIPLAVGKLQRKYFFSNNVALCWIIAFSVFFYLAAQLAKDVGVMSEFAFKYAALPFIIINGIVSFFL